MNTQKPTGRLALSGLLAAVVVILTVVTYFPIPGVAGAYINLGDVGVYLCAFLLGSPWGVLAAAIGSGLADLILGSALYAGPTLLIKGAMALAAALLVARSVKPLPALLLAGLLMPAGYFLFETFLYGAETAALSLPLNGLQYAAGVLIGYLAIRLAGRFKKN
ncbi:MAG TPA: ECF transporter S component [Feifaniaceae bacterium]|nr:ECF transporter S component [Feifaniaceae bacterium]